MLSNLSIMKDVLLAGFLADGNLSISQSSIQLGVRWPRQWWIICQSVLLHLTSTKSTVVESSGGTAVVLQRQTSQSIKGGGLVHRFWIKKRTVAWTVKQMLCVMIHFWTAATLPASSPVHIECNGLGSQAVSSPITLTQDAEPIVRSWVKWLKA